MQDLPTPSMFFQSPPENAAAMDRTKKGGTRLFQVPPFFVSVSAAMDPARGPSQSVIQLRSRPSAIISWRRRLYPRPASRATCPAAG